MKRNQHVIPQGGDWAVKGAGSAKASSVHQTQGAAISRAREIAINQRSEVVIHGRDGRIRDSDSYGADSCPPRDARH